ncbi:MAG: HEAT repeat domain-containing protein, partial [Thermoplasmata archaeon]|nr:HEAT repeat domain-containing protein [Thermoplasmata archaeon]
KEALRAITERAGGNIRELFRYCTTIMEQFGGAGRLITKDEAEEGIRIADEGKMMFTDEGNRLILQIAAEFGEFTPKDENFAVRLKEEGLDFGYRNLLNRLNALVELNLLRERTVKRRKFFSVPELLAKHLEEKEITVEMVDERAAPVHGISWTEMHQIAPSPVALERKKEMLQKLNEADLRTKVLIPLFQKMGYRGIIHYHGTLEKGKDIVFYGEDKLGEREYAGVVVKAAKIHGRAGEGGNASEVLVQAQQTFTIPFPDIVDGTEKRIDRVFIVSSHDIDSSARESISKTLESVNIYKRISFIPCDRLVDLIDNHMPEFFFGEYESFVRYLNAVMKNIRKMDLSAIGRREPMPLERIFVHLRLREAERFSSEALAESRRALSIPLEGESKPVEDMGTEGIHPPAGTISKMEFLREGPARERTYRDIHEMLEENSGRNFVILGKPGSGKTTLLKYLALHHIKENISKGFKEALPVFVSCRAIAKSKEDIVSSIRTNLKEYGFPQTKKEIREDLKKGRGILLLDGFDEVAEPEKQRALVEKIENFRAKYSKNRIIITSRPAGYHGEFPGLTVSELMDFDDEQMIEFVDNWFGNLGQKEQRKGEEIKKSIETNPEIRKIARNPLMISIIAVVYEEGKHLPENRAELYATCTDVLLNRWDEFRRVRNKFPHDKKRDFLRKLAFSAHVNHKRELTKAEIDALMEEHFPRLKLPLKQKDDFLRELWERNYLLRPVSARTYDFLHLSFQEYYTALELIFRSDGLEFVLGHARSSWWQEVILLYVGIKKDASELVERLLKEEDDIFFGNLFLCAGCIIDSEFTDVEVKEKVVERLMDIHGKYDFLDSEIISLLAKIEPLKIKSIFDTEQDSGVRRGIVLALGEIGGEDVKDTLIKLFRDEKDHDVRGSIVRVLGEIGGEDVKDTLINMLRDKNYTDVRGSIVLALGKIGGEDVKDTLIKLFRDKNYTDVRKYIVQALGEIGGEDVKDMLIKLFRDEKDSFVRWRIVQALGKIGGEDVKD